MAQRTVDKPADFLFVFIHGLHLIEVDLGNGDLEMR
jgi:hypothetical protein